MGGIASAYFSGALVEAYGPRGVFGLTALFPLMVSLSAVFISEQPVISSARHKRGSGSGEQDEAESGRAVTGPACISPLASCSHRFASCSHVNSIVAAVFFLHGCVPLSFAGAFLP